MQTRKLFPLFAIASITAPVGAETPERIRAAITQWDRNGDGRISEVEFRRLAEKNVAYLKSASRSEGRRFVYPKDATEESFRCYDMNGDGFITEAEMQKRTTTNPCELSGRN